MVKKFHKCQFLFPTTKWFQQYPISRVLQQNKQKPLCYIRNNPLCSGKLLSSSVPPSNSLVPWRAFELTRCPLRALNLPSALLLELQGYKDRCHLLFGCFQNWEAHLPKLASLWLPPFPTPWTQIDVTIDNRNLELRIFYWNFAYQLASFALMWWVCFQLKGQRQWLLVAQIRITCAEKH